MIRYQFILLGTLLFAFVSLDGQTSSKVIPKSSKWKLIEYLKADGTMVANDSQPSYANKNGTKFITLDFVTDTTFSFKTFTNDGGGKVYYNNSSNSIIIKCKTMTKVGEYPWGKLFLKTMPLVTNFKITDTDLKLLYDNGTKYIHFVKN